MALTRRLIPPVMGGQWWSATLLGRRNHCRVFSRQELWGVREYSMRAERRYHGIRWTVTADSKINLGIIHNRHGYTPNADLEAYLTVLVRE
eukprot:7198606-Pyramimonas_sp.AAC.1